MASKCPQRPPPTVTLEPRTTTPSEMWWYTLPGGSRGVIVGDVIWAATYILFHAFRRRWRCVSLRFPKARWGGLRAQTVTLSSPADLHRLRAVDVEAVVHRHGAGAPDAGENVRMAVGAQRMAAPGGEFAGGRGSEPVANPALDGEARPASFP